MIFFFLHSFHLEEAISFGVCLLLKSMQMLFYYYFFYCLLFLINPWQCHSRCHVDITALPTKQTNCLELPLEKHPGSLLMLIAVAPCTGVSISDLCVCPLGDPNERQQISQRYVSLCFFFLSFSSFFFFLPFFFFLSFEIVKIAGQKIKFSSHNNMSPTKENY